MAIEKTIAIPDSILNAENITYENTNSGLTSTNTQGAIDELNTKIDNIEITGGGDGVSLNAVQQLVDESYENAVAYTDGAVNGKADLNHSHVITEIENLQTMLDSKADSSVLNDYYTKTQVDDMELITLDDIDTICGSTI